jgi:glycine/D-amino acid oxidase-like deaminating enzyme
MSRYDYIVVGAGISGCSVSYELLKYTNSVLLIDASSNVAAGASGAAGAFLSPLLGKPNFFKDLVASALQYSTDLYKKNFPNIIFNCGTTRIPKNEMDQKKFLEYIPYMDFEYEKDGDGYFFKIASVINSFGVCKMMTTAFVNDSNRIQTKFNHKVKSILYDGEYWIVDKELKAKNLILTTGVNLDLLDESYLKMRPIWGRRVDVKTTTNLKHNYHKACSVSKSFKVDDEYFKVSIGATHHRDIKDTEDSSLDIKNLIKKAEDIKKLDNLEVTKEYIGARACSVDYIPMVGTIINSKKTLEKFPSLVKGTDIQSSRFSRYKNLYILNGVGGRGFVLAPYLAKQLVDNIINETPIDPKITVDRLFKKNVKREDDE